MHRTWCTEKTLCEGLSWVSPHSVFAPTKVFPPCVIIMPGVCVRGEEPPSSQDVKLMGEILWR